MLTVVEMFKRFDWMYKLDISMYVYAKEKKSCMCELQIK